MATVRVDDQLHAGKVVVGYEGWGILGADIPSTGTHGAPPLYNDLSLPADATAEFRWLPEQPTGPGNVTNFVAYEDGSFAFDNDADGTYVGTYAAWKNGVKYTGVSGETYTVNIGAADETAPTLSSLQIASPTASGGNLTVSTDEGNGAIYYVVVADGEVPTAANVIAGETEGGGAPAASGNVSVSATGTQTLGNITALDDGVTYDLYAVHVDAADNESSLASGTVTTLDATAPTLSSPTTALVNVTTVTPQVDTDEANGTLYVVVVPDGDTPSAAQIKAGQQSDGSAAIDAASQSVSVAGTQVLATLTGLSEETAYELAFVHRDASGNDSDAATAGFTTLALPAAGAGQAHGGGICTVGGLMSR